MGSGTAIKQFELAKLAALRKVCLQINLIPPHHALTPTEEVLMARLSRYGEGLIPLCLSVILDSDAQPVRKGAATLLLECFIPTWKDNVPPEVLGMVVDRSDAEVRRWRLQVINRDGAQCCRCGGDESLDVHHIARWADHPELRVHPDNGIVLCRECHLEEHGKSARQ